MKVPNLFSKVMLVVGIISLIFAVLVVIFIVIKSGRKRRIAEVPVDKVVTLEYWGLFEPEEVMKPIIEKYMLEHPKVRINYREQKYSDDLFRYRRTLLKRLRDGTGPDIFRVHSTWLPSYIDNVSFNNKSITLTEFKSRFYPIYTNQCVTRNGDILCIPLMYDGLVLLYNKDLFDETGVSIPSTWDELKNTARILHKVDKDGNIIRGGVALGSVDNVANSTDILSLMMNQNEINVPNALDTQMAFDTFKFYIRFSNPDNLWNKSMPNSVYSFAAGDVAMIFARSDDIRKVLELNPTMNIGVAPVPQLPTIDGGTTNKSWATLWVESVSRSISAEKQKAAWDFLVWMSLPDQQVARYSKSSEFRKFGEIPSEMSLLNNLKSIKYVGPIVAQAPFAETSIFSDNAGNDDYSGIIKDVVRKTLTDRNYRKMWDYLKEAKMRFFSIKR